MYILKVLRIIILLNLFNVLTLLIIIPIFNFNLLYKINIFVLFLLMYLQFNICLNIN
jgi:hypothetical protein